MFTNGNTAMDGTSAWLDADPVAVEELWSFRKCLLLHYTQAYRYNIWAETPSFGFDDIAADAQKLLSCAPFPFGRVFLYVSTQGEAYRLL